MIRFILSMYVTHLHLSTTGMRERIAKTIPGCFQEVWHITEEVQSMTISVRVDGFEWQISLSFLTHAIKSSI